MPWPRGLASQPKFAKPELACVLAMGGQTDSQVAKKVVNFTHIQMTCDQLVSTCVGWPNGKKLAPTWTRPKSMQIIASQRSGWRNGKSKNCVDLRRLASSFGQGCICLLFSDFSNVCHPYFSETNHVMLFLVMRFIALVDEIWFMLISSRHFCKRHCTQPLPNFN